MPPSGIGAWYARVADFSVESLFARKARVKPPRTVFVREPLPDHYFDKKGKPTLDRTYASNQIISSRYSLITFLPRNLLEQFRRIANVFFLAIAILQFFPKFSTISPGLVILPLIIVLGLAAIKDGYEDYKRHLSDRQVNHSRTRVLHAEGWSNPNAMESKSRTFTRGIVATGRKVIPKGIKKKGPTKEEQDMEVLIEYDDQPPQPPSSDDHHHTKLASRLHLHHDETSQPHWRTLIWEDIRVGDFIKIMDDEPIPADVIICATSEEENVAFVETKNLDGETNLKSRNAAAPLTHLRTADACADSKNSFHVDCDVTDSNMYRLNAAATVHGEKYPIDLQNILLRGTILRNTRWVIGLVLFTGDETKIVMNTGNTPSKRSKVERQMNPQVFINLIILALMAIACAIADSTLEAYYYEREAPWQFMSDQPDDNPRINGLVTWAFAYITFQNIVPISLYISIEFVRTCQALFIYFDKDICYEKTGQATLARSWNLSDDLGQIEYIFSDKTGTLTQNSMVFRQCSINGKVYAGDDDDAMSERNTTPTIPVEKVKDVDRSVSTASTDVPQTLKPDTAKLPAGVLKHFTDASLAADLEQAIHADPNSEFSAHARSLNGFFAVLALCHTVLTSVDPETGAIEYKAQSPDEAALVQAAADVGFVFRGRDKEILRLQTPFSTELEEYELLNILEFTSARKRMSIVLRRTDVEDSRLFLMTKGADNVVFERLKDGGEELKDMTESHLSNFAGEGLRTLTLAYKVIPEQEYEQWSQRYYDASIALDNREEKIEAVSDELERDLRLLGATAIEDRLQDGVPETIADLKRAGIKIWVATGDKLETAIAIGHSTNLISPQSNIIVIRKGGANSRPVYQQMTNAVEEFFPDSDLVEEFKQKPAPRRSTSSTHGAGDKAYPLRRVNTGMSSVVGADNGQRPGGFVLVVDGAALETALGDEEHKDLLLRLAMLCEGVICCRVSPLQKALIVKLVKDGLGVMTLAIGDGANDVSMIQAAHVGVGISGEEGLQAVNSSDYAIGQFRFLKKLLLVHGHWSYARNGNMILNFFYKNLVCIGVLWWFQIYCAWSSNYVFEYTYLLFWNSFWTIAPVIALGVFDRMIDYHTLMQVPELYHFGREGKWFGMKLFTIYMVDAVYQSAVIYFIVQYAYESPTARTDGYNGYVYEFSTTMVLVAVFITNGYNGLNTRAWTGWVFFAVSVGTILVWGFTAIYSVIRPGWFITNVYGNNKFLFTSAYFWLCMPVVICLSFLPRYLAKAYKAGYAPDDLDILRYANKQDPHRDLGLEAYDNTQNSTAPYGRSTARSTSRVGSSSMVPASSRASSVDSRYAARPSFDPRASSRTDMATGLRSVHRGFDFAQEEGGVEMRRMQSNLSEVRNSSRNLTTQSAAPHHRSRLGHIFSIRKGVRRKPTVT
ncbi:hypothetical protein BDV98DRAFT_599642 [Pterulicium gracile]|uniref:Phospholipid-transporting ATPase n=1 Tax=Pterulicium gracile TaxID=1884261 RepID=A0A5C3R314_9AGAR|nr:hypothetical protein BDV98DRAFT_599642 [Pterula gracilis]